MEYWFIRMKSRTEYRYWNEFNQYEHWLIDNDLLNSRECYCLTHKICDEYLIGLSEYVLIMRKRYKWNTVRSKVSRLIQCFRSTMSIKLFKKIRDAIVF